MGHLVGGDDQRRGQADHVRGGGVDQDAGVAGGGLDRLGDRVGEHDAEQQPRAAHLDDALDLLEPRAELRAPSVALVSRSSASIVSSTARAAAALIGLPPKVEPCEPGANSGVAG